MRLIDADEVLEAEFTIEEDGAIGCVVDCEVIRRSPTIDAVPVVRCGLCLYCDTKDCPMSGTPGRVSVSDFCSYGERKYNG